MSIKKHSAFASFTKNHQLGIPTIIRLTPIEVSPPTLNFTVPATPDVVIADKVTVTSFPASVFPMFIGVAVTMGENLNSLGKL